MKRLVVCLSGGMDSAALLEMLEEVRDRPHLALFFNYGQPCFEEEWMAAWRLAIHYRIDLQWVKLKIPFLEGTGRANVFHGRNTLFATIAAGYGDLVWFGFCREDQPDYPDCSPAWMDACERLLTSFYRPVRIEAPLISKTKREIREMVPPDLLGRTYSCYRADGPCNECASCVLRNEALGA